MTPRQLNALSAYARSTHEELRVAVRQAPTQATRVQTLYQVLNGHPAQAINTILGRTRRRRQGIFFSGATWAKLIAGELPIDRCERVLDPACGIGDLLLAVARELPLRANAQATLRAWSTQLAGYDLHSPFVTLAWNRLQALAIERHGVALRTTALSTEIPESFRIGNALKQPWPLRSGDGLVMNPPFQAVVVPADTVNGAGRHTAALPFLERALGAAPPGVHVVALVPEVIRSGSRYARLRDWLAERTETLRLESHGRFSQEANIDVALLVATTRAPSKRRSLVCAEPQAAEARPEPSAVRTLGELCDVRVGAVVPHRTLKDGPRRPYLAVSDATPWVEIQPTRYATYRATTHTPPFVVTRRTSGPRDQQRIRATIIGGSEPVLVENHLLVLTPRERTVEACRALADVLGRPAVHTWLNQRIRCRHLTVGAVQEIPVL